MNDDRSKPQIGDITGDTYSFQHRPRSGRRGSRVGILFKHHVKSTLLPHTPFDPFEHMEASIATSKVHVHLIVVYHCPASVKNKHTVDKFLTEIATSLENITISITHPSVNTHP